jgi:hypothetical protein
MSAHSTVAMVMAGVLGCAGLGGCDVHFGTKKKTVDAGPPRCGNGVVEGEEECDGNDLAGKTCHSLGFDSGELSCGSDCTYNVALCIGCGNGKKDIHEDCDPSSPEPPGETCQTLGLGAGTLLCTQDCHWDESYCFKGRLGSACGTNADCEPGQTCLTEQDSGWPGGFCTKACSAEADCPMSFQCVPDDQGNHHCMASCTKTTDCRTGYACFDAYGTQTPVCWPHCTVDRHCRQAECTKITNLCYIHGGLVPTGGNCAANAECRGNLCLIDGMLAYCTSRCRRSDLVCPPDSQCVDYYDGERADMGLCLESCNNQTDCEQHENTLIQCTGHVCQPL